MDHTQLPVAWVDDAHPTQAGDGQRGHPAGGVNKAHTAISDAPVTEATDAQPILQACSTKTTALPKRPGSYRGRNVVDGIPFLTIHGSSVPTRASNILARADVDKNNSARSVG